MKKIQENFDESKSSGQHITSKRYKLLKNNIMSLVLVVGLLMVVGVFAGNVIFQDGSLDVEEGLDVDGNLSIDTNTLFVDSVNNKVGIGTTGPVTLLEISKTANTGAFSNSVSDFYQNWEANGASAFAIAMTINNNAGENKTAGLITNGGFDLIFGAGGARVMQIDESTGNVGIGTISPSYPLTVYGDSSDVSIWAEKNVSATGYITRTSVYDKSQGSALDKVKDADDYMNGEEIDHTAFYGYVSYDVEDCEIDEKTEEKTCVVVGTEEGVLLDHEVDLLRQAVFELKVQNQDLKTELCTKDDTYSWC